MGWWNCNYDTEIDLILKKQNSILYNQNQIISMLKLLIKGEIRMSAELDELKAQVEQNTNVELSAVELIRGLADQIAVLVVNNDTAGLAELSGKLKTSAEALAAAVTANASTEPVQPTV